MAEIHLIEPPVEKKYTWLQPVFITGGLFTLAGAIAAGFVAFQRDILLGFAISFVGLLALLFILALYQAMRVFLAIEENTRRANTMAPYTMQMTHSLTATQNVMEEITSSMQALSEEMGRMNGELHELAEKLNAIGTYSRTTAVLLHHQIKSGKRAWETNGQAAPDAAPGSAGTSEPTPASTPKERAIGAEQAIAEAEDDGLGYDEFGGSTGEESAEGDLEYHVDSNGRVRRVTRRLSESDLVS